jgi:hypothetical protein
MGRAGAAIFAPTLRVTSDSIEEDQVDGAAEQEREARVDQQQWPEMRFYTARRKYGPKGGG